MFHLAVIVWFVTIRGKKCCAVGSADPSVFLLGGHVSLVTSCPVLNKALKHEITRGCSGSSTHS